MTGDWIRDAARRLHSRIADAGGLNGERTLAALTDELSTFAAEARQLWLREFAAGPDHELTLVMISAAGWEGWANLVLDGERRHIAVLPPPFVDILKEYIPLRHWPRA